MLLNPNESRKRKSCGPSTKLKKKNLHGCVSDHKDEFISVSGEVLSCDGCRTQISEKVSSLKSHITSKRHGEAKLARRNAKAKQQLIAKALQQHSKELHPKRDTSKNQACLPL